MDDGDIGEDEGRRAEKDLDDLTRNTSIRSTKWRRIKKRTNGGLGSRSLSMSTQTQNPSGYHHSTARRSDPVRDPETGIVPQTRRDVGRSKCQATVIREQLPLRNGSNPTEPAVDDDEVVETEDMDFGSDPAADYGPKDLRF